MQVLEVPLKNKAFPYLNNVLFKCILQGFGPVAYLLGSRGGDGTDLNI